MFLFACPKRNPKGQPVTWPRSAWLPGVYALFLRVLFARNGRHRKVAKFIPPAGYSAESLIRSRLCCSATRNGLYMYYFNYGETF